MVTFDRICIPMGVACDLDCKYCYRQAGKCTVHRLTPKMAQYLENLDPAKTYCVIASGGEPLLYWEKVKELFSHVPQGIYKKVMTNGTHLTQEIIDYINENEIELHFSHDGAITEYSRGVDVLEDPKILALVKQAKVMRVHSTIITGNEDIVANWKYICEKLGRSDFMYTCNTVYGDINRPELVENFDYDTYIRTWIEFKMLIKRNSDRYRPPKAGGRSLGVNILPDGTVCSMLGMDYYGTIDDDLQTIKTRISESERVQLCDHTDCPAKAQGLCSNPKSIATPHSCKAQSLSLLGLAYVKHISRVHDVKCF